MVKNRKFWLCFTLFVILLSMLICLTACNRKKQQSENPVDNAIQAMVDHEVFIKYTNNDNELYYQIIASDELIEQLDLQNWEPNETGVSLDFDQYLVIRIAEKYEIVICSNQVGKIYDYYGTYGTYTSETLFYKTALNLQTLMDFLDKYAQCLPGCNIGFEN